MPYCTHCGAPVTATGPICTQCGKPHDATAKPGEPSAAPREASKSGPSLLIIVVIAIAGFICFIPILGIVAAIAIPNFLNAVDRAKQKRTIADIQTIGTAIEEYSIDTGFYPRVDSATDLKTTLGPEHTGKIPERDGWNRQLRYACWQEKPDSTGCDHYRIASAGKDGVLEHHDLRDYPSSAFDDFDCDIVFDSGKFVQWPLRLHDFGGRKP